MTGKGDLLDIDRLARRPRHPYLSRRTPTSTSPAVSGAVLNAIVRRVEEREEASDRPLAPVSPLSLDEAANIAPLRDLADIVPSGRGRG